MSEDAIVRNCSPTLAGIKTANMFTCKYNSAEDMKHAIRHWNHKLQSKGIRVLPLKYQDQQALIYLYRPSHLSADLKDETACAILRKYGYTPEYSERCITRLIRRLRENDGFPHEIGLFLGYPPEDVHGFIEQKACGYKCVGCWKVYGDEQKCKKLFRSYKTCTRKYEELLRNGKTVESMTVSET